MSTRTRVDELLAAAERQPFTGWDFGWINERIVADPLPWDYDETVVTHARRSPDLLDLGTGGGEWLAELPYRPPRTVATEAWPPNLGIAKARLEPLGVEVVRVPSARDNTGKPVSGLSTRLPFADASFHLTVDRHESFEPSEVARVLARRGWFITQQVDVHNDDGYRELFGLEPESDPGDPWEAWMPAQLRRVGFDIVEHASAPLVQHIHDVGALAYGLKAIPWMVPGFTIAKYRDRLRELQAEIDRDGPLVVHQRRFFVRAQKR